MKLKVNGKEAYFTTSGREIVKDQPTIVFVHGSGLTHVTWVLQNPCHMGETTSVNKNNCWLIFNNFSPTSGKISFFPVYF